MKSFTVNIEQDQDSGDFVLPFPPELLSQMGWSEGTELWWIDNNDGTYTLKTKNNDNEIDTDVGC